MRSMHRTTDISNYDWILITFIAAKYCVVKYFYSGSTFGLSLSILNIRDFFDSG